MNRYKFLKEFCPVLDRLADYGDKDLKMNHAYLDEVVGLIKVQGYRREFVNRATGALKRRMQLTDFQDSLIGSLLEILEEGVSV